MKSPPAPLVPQESVPRQKIPRSRATSRLGAIPIHIQFSIGDLRRSGDQ
jgi:hypothetical protein